MATNVKLGVDTSGFKAGIQDANAQLKSFDAQLKYAETAMKNAGNAEAGMTTKMNALNGKLNTQKQLIQQYEQRLKQLREQGVDPLSAEYQKLNAALLNTRTGMLETEAALNGLNDSTVQAAAGTDKLAQSMNGISKKISLDQVISGINTITGGMEKAAQKAVELGTAIWDNIMDSARMADDIATQAMVLDMSTTQYQQYKGVFDTIAEMTVNDYMKAKRKIQNVLNNPSNDQTEVLSALGFGPLVGKNGETQAAYIADNWEDAMWVLAGEIRDRVERGDLSADMADIYGEALFGKSYANMRPFLAMGKEGFEAALGKVNTASEEAIENGAALNDAVIALQGSFNALKEEVTGAMAPALTEAANAINGLLGSILEYLKTPQGKEMLERLGTAISGLFEDLGNIDPEGVVNNFVSLFNQVVSSFEWLINNWESVKTALIGIAAGFGVLKITSAALNITKTIQGLGDLLPKGGTPTTTAPTAGGGGGWFGGNGSEMGIVSKAGALGLTGLTMLAPALLTKVLSDMIPEENKLFSPERVKAATYSQDEVDRLREWVELQNELVRLENEPGVDIFSDARYGEALDKIAGMNVQQGDLWNRYWDYLVSNDKMPGKDILPTEILDQMAGEGVPIKIDPVAPDDAATIISEDIGSVPITVTIRDVEGKELLELIGGVDGSHANGLPWVPYDGYLAMLHRGERVMTASENRQYTYYNNTYFGGVNLNNGMEIDALVDSIDRHNRRRQSGFGE